MARGRKPPTQADPVDFAGLRSYIGYMARQAQTAVFRDFARITEETGLTPGEFSLLTLIGANPGINQITLVTLHNLDKSTLSLAIRDLMRQELIERKKDSRDGRYYALRLTRQGALQLEKATALVEEQERKMDATLKAGERAQLLDMLRRLSKAFD
ncbi:MAG: MarR family transcriptional regulator [Alphaproteobacteria bacterium]|nr:MarR family transcriptional regulator [Alphaproteobacteria bacterium]